MSEIYRITTRYATGEIIVSNGMVVKTPHILRHFEGSLLPNVIGWLEAHHGTIEVVGEEVKK